MTRTVYVIAWRNTELGGFEWRISSEQRAAWIAEGGRGDYERYGNEIVGEFEYEVPLSADGYDISEELEDVFDEALASPEKYGTRLYPTVPEAV